MRTPGSGCKKKRERLLRTLKQVDAFAKASLLAKLVNLTENQVRQLLPEFKEDGIVEYDEERRMWRIK